MAAPSDAPSKKKPSGAEYRKRAKEKAEKDASAKRVGDYLASNQWGGNLYRAADAQFDPNGPPIQLPIYGQPPTTLVKAVQAAILQLEQGAFYACAYLWDGMLRDDRLASTLGVRIDRLIGSPLELAPAISDDDEEEEESEKGKPDEGDDLEEEALDVDEAKRIAKDCEQQITRIMPLHQVYELMRWGLGLSVGLAQKLTTRTKKSSTPTFEVWNLRYLRYDWLLRCYRLVTENKGEISIEKDDPEWIVYEPFGPMGWLHGALIRPAVTPWLIRYWTRTWWSRFQEVHGQPIRLGILPADRQPNDERLFLQQLSNLAHEAVIRLPQGKEDGNAFDVKLLEATANNWQGFKELLQHCDDSFAILFLGQRQSTDGQSGLGSQENAGESTTMRITRRDALIADVLRDQLLKKWAKDNYGNEEYAPFIRWRTEPPEDESKTAKVDLAVAQALAAFKTSGAPLNVRAYLEERGYPLLTEEEHLADKQQNVQDAQDMMVATTPMEPSDDAETEDDKPGKRAGFAAKSDDADA